MILNDQRWFGSFKERTAGVGAVLERASKVRGILHHEPLRVVQLLPLNVLFPTANPTIIQLHLWFPSPHLNITTLLSQSHSQHRVDFKKPPHSSHHPIRQGWGLIVFLLKLSPKNVPPEDLDTCSTPFFNWRVLPHRFGVPLLTAVTLLSLLLARKSKAHGNCLLRSLLSQRLSCTLIVLLQLQPVICRDNFVGQSNCCAQSKCSVQDLLFSWASFTCTYPCTLSWRFVYLARAALAICDQRTTYKQ